MLNRTCWCRSLRSTALSQKTQNQPSFTRRVVQLLIVACALNVLLVSGDDSVTNIQSASAQQQQKQQQSQYEQRRHRLLFLRNNNKNYTNSHENNSWTTRYRSISESLTSASLPSSSTVCASGERVQRQLPEALIIGVKKSGTYALLRYLSINPQIGAALRLTGCELNEIHFFDQERNYARGLDWYRSQMPLVCGSAFNETNANAANDDDISSSKRIVVVEKTPGYFRSAEAPARVHAYSARTKLILIVREPLRRMQSELTHCDMRQRRLKLPNKCAAMNAVFEALFFGARRNASSSSNVVAEDTSDGGDDDNNGNDENDIDNSTDEAVERELLRNRFVRNSAYYLDMPAWLERFALNKSLFVLNGESFIRAPWLELRRLERFLGVRSFIRRDHFHFDKQKSFYCLRGGSTTGANATMSITTMTTAETSETSGCLGKNKGRKAHVHLSDRVKAELRRYFAKWNERFYQTIGQSFNW